MNKKIFIKLICIIITLLLSSFLIITNFSNAEETINSILSEAQNQTNQPVVTKTTTVMALIIRVFEIIAIGIAIIMLIYIAIKYMTAAPDEKAEFKKSATGYIVGAIILFSVSGILGLIEKFAEVFN